jgi:hypothetical protein
MSKDTLATALGSGIGIEQLMEAFDYLAELNASPDWKFFALAIKGAAIFALGFFAFRGSPAPTNVVAPVVLLALLLGGCSAGSKERIEKAHYLFLEVVKGAKTVVVSGCEGLPTLQVALDVVEPYMKGSDVVLMRVGEAAAVDVCAKITAQLPSQ